VLAGLLAIIGIKFMPPAIEANKLTKEFRSGKVRALDELNLSIEKGEVFGIIGPNGAGKTTFMSCLLGLLYPTSGTISIDGMPPDAMEVHRKIGYLPERLDFIKWMTGKELMNFHADLLGVPPKSASVEIERLLRLVELDQGAWFRKIKSYSRGMLQRIGMAQALLGSPAFLFLDEPSSGLDPIGVRLFRNILKNLKESGVTIVINSHQLDQLEKVCDRVAFIKGGKVQTIENMNAITIKEGTIVLRWTVDKESKVSTEVLSKVVAAVGAELQNFEFPQALIKITGDEMSTKLIHELDLAGLPVAQASPSAGRLESFFDQ
jgi:ABC-2 type transport system ATP-binding protein